MLPFKIFIASFSRSSNGAIEKITEYLKRRNLLTNNVDDAIYILAVGDRIETFNFVLQQWLNGKHIIHLWAGDVSQGTYDEVFRHSISLMSDLQLCTNMDARKVVSRIFKAVGKKPNAKIVGNVMLDNMVFDESVFDETIIKGNYDLVLYNPCLETITEDLKEINDQIILDEKPYIWIKPNMDRGYEKITQYNSPNLPRDKFLTLLKYCNKFITNSSCSYYEAPFLIKEEQIFRVGLRNKNRNSIKGMDKKNATKNIVKEICKLDKANYPRKRTKRIPLDSQAQGQVEVGGQN